MRGLRLSLLAFILAGCTVEPGPLDSHDPTADSAHQETIAPSNSSSDDDAPSVDDQDDIATGDSTLEEPTAHAAPRDDAPEDPGATPPPSPRPCRSSEDCKAPEVCAEVADGSICVAPSTLPQGVEPLPTGPAGQPAPPVGMLEGLRRLHTAEATQ